MHNTARFTLLIIITMVFTGLMPADGAQDIFDRRHWSDTFGEYRNYRIVLPRDYETSGKHYPVIYYFHGHSGRYKGEQYGNGQVFLSEQVDFVRNNDVIVVKWDGYVEGDYSWFYGGTPYDIQNRGFGMDFGIYFLDLVAHIDSSYRTLTDRQHRATSGLSMGGFMSLYISGRFPDLVGSASAFDPAHENHVGPPGMKVLRKHANHGLNHGHSKILLVKTSGDYLGQHHSLLKDIYARTPEVDFTFRQDEYHRHWVTGIDRTFAFHMAAFGDSNLSAHPGKWDYDNAYGKFSVWGYDVTVENKQTGFTCFRDVSRGYFRVFTRRYSPDGPPVEGQLLRITTDALYGSGKTYRIMDYSHADGAMKLYELKATSDGCLEFALDGLGHDITIASGKEERAPVLLPVGTGENPVVRPDVTEHLPLKLMNANGVTVRNVSATLSSEYPTVGIDGAELNIDSLLPGEVVDIGERFDLRFTSSGQGFQHCRLNLRVSASGYYSDATYRIDVRVLPTPLTPPEEVVILDGRTHAFEVFRQGGNKGGGRMIERTVTEGCGNGDGIPDPGEEITVWVRILQGLDPFDKNSWHRTKVYSHDPHIVESSDFAEQKGIEWTGVRDHTSAVTISPDYPPGQEIQLYLCNESYSFHWTPDARYGVQLLRQAIQLHSEHVHGYSLKVGR